MGGRQNNEAISQLHLSKDILSARFNVIQCQPFAFSKSAIETLVSNRNNRNTRKKVWICSKLTIKTRERRHYRHSGVFIIDFEHISFSSASIVDFEQLNKSSVDLTSLEKWEWIQSDLRNYPFSTFKNFSNKLFWHVMLSGTKYSRITCGRQTLKNLEC